jgi:4-oxalocrotonate tautomerase
MGTGQTTSEQKKLLVENFTAGAMEITGLPAHAFTVLITELPPENIGIGGKTLRELHQQGKP